MRNEIIKGSVDFHRKVQRELGFILDKAPPCPDSADGGCIGGHCIRCAARELAAVAGPKYVKPIAIVDEWERNRRFLLDLPRDEYLGLERDVLVRTGRYFSDERVWLVGGLAEVDGRYLASVEPFTRE